MLIIFLLAGEMDQADDELRETIQMIWPFQAKKMLDILLPRKDNLNKSNLTVGKLYGGLLILESWRNTRFGQIESGVPVCRNFYSFSHCERSIFYSFIVLMDSKIKLNYCEGT